MEHRAHTTGRRETDPYHAVVGFNPFRRHRTRPGDVLAVVLTLVAALGLVLWAMLAGR